MNGSGKTAIAAHTAISSDLTYIKIISPGDFVGLTENAKIHNLVSTFNMAYRSK